jgi:hypothetical protein
MGLLSTIGAASGRAFGLTRVGAAIRDAYFNLTTLLLPGNGTNGAQNNTFLDSSTNNFTITRNGNTTQGTFSPFSQTGWSNYFVSPNYLRVPYNSAFLWSTGARTFEAWVYVNSVSANNVIFGLDNDSSSNTWELFINTSGQVVFRYWNGSSQTVTTSSSVATNTWTHVAFVYDGTSAITIYLNGVSAGTGTKQGTPITDNNTLLIGHTLAGLAGNSYLNGYISNVRFTSAVVYTANFTPSTIPLTAISNTSLLTCQSNRFVDNSTNAFAITVLNSPSVQSFSPFAPTAAYSASTVGGSGYFDGTGDYLTVADNAALEPVGNNFCIEISYYPTSVSGNRVLISKRVNPSTDYGFLIYLSGATVLTYISSANSSYDIANGNNIGTLVNNQWHHIAIFRVGNAWYASLNGAITTLASNNSLSVNNNAGNWAIGADSNGGTVVQGFISNVRFVIGSSVYSSTSAPFPTAPLTAITNTQLLLNYTNAGITDATAKNVLETVGNAQISTTQSKFGGSSMYFDGTGDWLLMPHTIDQMFGTGAFTVEFWLYLGATGAARGLVAKGTSTTGWLVSLDSSNRVVFTYTTSTITSTGAISGTTWAHIAVVREGTGTNQTKIYINGTNDGTGTVSTDFNQTSVMYVGANRTGGDALNGYIDDLRVTRGYARYTSNFTAPTAAFSLQ